MTVKDHPPSLIVGLGNPDNKLLKSRHNIGFWFIDSLAQHLNVTFKDNLKKGFCNVEYKSEKINLKLLKPMTYINDSGTPLKSFIKIRSQI